MDVKAPAQPVVISCSDLRSGGLARHCEPVTVGVPFAAGAIPGGQTVELRDPDGRMVPVQTRVLSRWSDGSARWLLVDFQATVPAAASRSFYLYPVQSPAPSTAARRIVLTSDGDQLAVVDTGAAIFRMRSGGHVPFDDIVVRSGAPIDCRQSGLAAVGDSGACQLSVSSVLVEEAGDLRSVIRLTGSVADGTKTLADAIIRIHFFADSASTHLSVTLRNPRRARHRGGLWDLGDAGSIYLRQLTFSIANLADGDRQMWWSVDPDTPFERRDGDLHCYQESSGGERWHSTNHVSRDGVIPLSFRGYRIDAAGSRRTGERATPCVIVADQNAHCAITMRAFWENFPKSLTAGPDSITLGLFPGEFPDVHELQGGEQKTFAFHVAWARDAVTPRSLDWSRTPLFARVSPDCYASSGAVPFLSPASDDPHEDYKTLVGAAIEGPDSFFGKRERIDEYGWRNFGDLYADHEAAFHKGPDPLVSHYNNQYDAVWGFGVQFMRSGDRRWWTLMTDLAAHVVDIDVYHTSADKSAYNHGLFWHTYHYIDAGTSTHRSYPKTSGLPGGGPSPSHLYTSGLLLHHYLTGDAASLETVLELAQYAIDADDGSLTVFRWLDAGYTGLISEAGTPGYHGPARAPANAINALVDGHRAGGGRRFLDKAEQVIRRCIHPDDDIDARDLLNTEHRWYYTVFLQSLGRYLDYKVEIGENDQMYAYARSCLIAYARWMAAREYPYLEHPEKLEFPTETWAAQDIRKSEVFNDAARHVGPEEIARFLERSAFFFGSATSTLRAMPTSTLTRPLVILLANGYRQARFRQPSTIVSAPAPLAAPDSGVPEQFVPQKARAMRKARLISAAAGVLFAFAALYLIFAAGRSLG